MSEIIMPTEKIGGGGINLSPFDDYANYTKPSAVGSRFSSNDMTGGYKIVGDNVYVYIVVFITKSAFGSGNVRSDQR